MHCYIIGCLIERTKNTSIYLSGVAVCTTNDISKEVLDNEFDGNPQKIYYPIEMVSLF